MPRRLTLQLVVAAVTLAVAGAAVAVVRTVSGDEGPPSDPRAAVVAALAARPDDGPRTARYLVRYIAEGPAGRRELATFEGVADLARQRFLARGRFVPEEDGEPPRQFDSFVFSEWEYQRSAGESRWTRRFVDPTELGSPMPDLAVVGRRGEHPSGPAYADDLDARTRIVDALVTDVRLAGQEEHHESTAWHYRVSVDAARATTLLPEPLQPEMRQWVENDGPRELDVWLDGRGRIRRLSIFYDFHEGAGFRIENEFWDHGRPGRVDLPSDLGDPTAEGGEGISSFAVEPGVRIDEGSPSLDMWIFGGDEPGEVVELIVSGWPAPPERRRLTLRLSPPAGRHLEPGEYRGANLRTSTPPPPSSFDILGAEVDDRCARNRPRSGTLTLAEAVMYEERFYVRLHAQFTFTCEPVAGGPPLTFTGEANYHALT
jgi:hypothetical protein